MSTSKREQTVRQEMEELKSKNKELSRQTHKIHDFLGFLERELRDSSSQLDTTIVMPLYEEPYDEFEETRIMPSGGSLSGRLKRLKEEVVVHNEEL